MFKRIAHLWMVMKSSWSEDPAARGAAKVSIGGILIWEGLFGTVRDIGEKNGKSGLIGSVLGLGFAIAMLYFLSMFEMTADKITDPRVTTGEVVAQDQEQVRDSETGEMETMYRSHYQFQDGQGKAHTFEGSSSSSSPTMKGTEVEITHQKGNPELAYRSDGIDGFVNENIMLVFTWFAWFMVAGAVFGILFSMALIGFGIWLIRGGLADRRLAEEETSFFSDLMSLFTEIKSGNMTPSSLGMESPKGSNDAE